MPYTDISKTGPLTYSEIRKQNPLTPEEVDSDIKKIGKKSLESGVGTLSPRKFFEKSVEYGHSQYKDPVKWAQELRQAGYGESKYDALIAPTTNIEEIQENRALNQTAGEKLLNGVLKGAITTGTTFINTLAGMPFGAAEAIFKGDISKIWDNEITNAMSGIEEWSEKALPNYYSKDELESPWYTQLFTANFLGDKLIKNFGFTIGAGAAGTMVLSKLPKLLPKVLTKAAMAAGRTEKDIAAIGRTANSLSTSFLSAVGEGSIEALNATKEWSKEMTNDINQQYLEEVQAIQEKYRQAAQDLEEDFLNNPPELVRNADGSISNPAAEERAQMMKALEQSMIQEIYNAENTKNQRMSQIASQRAQTGNAVLGFNLPILTMGNLLTLGKVYAKGYTAEMSSVGEHIKFHPEDLANVGKTVKETSRRLTWKGIRDVEKEVPKEAFTSNVSVGRNVAKTLASAGWEGTEEMLQAWASNASKDYNTDYYNQSVDPEYTDKTASMWKSLGDSFVETFGNVDNWEEFAIGMLSGGISNMILGQTKELGRERKAVNEAVANLNNAVNTFNNREMIKGINRHQYLEDLKTSAAIEHREKEYKDADFAQLASDVVLFGSLGKLDELKAIIDYNLTNLSDSELEQLSQELSQKEVNGPENNYFAKLDLAGKRKYLKDQQDKYHKVIDDYNNEYSELTSLTGNVFSQEQMSELVYYRLLAKNSTERINQIREEQKNLIKDSEFNGTLSGVDIIKQINTLESQAKDLLGKVEQYNKRKTNLGKQLKALRKTGQTTEGSTSENYKEYLINNLKDVISKTNDTKEQLKSVNEPLESLKSFRDGYETIKKQLLDIYDSLNSLNEITAKSLVSDNMVQFAQSMVSSLLLEGAYMNALKAYGVDMTNPAFLEFHQDTQDIMELMSDVERYNKTLAEALKNPEKLEEKNNRIRNRVKKWKKKLGAKKEIRKFKEVKSYEELETLMDNVNDDLKDELLAQLKEDEALSKFVEHYEQVYNKIKEVSKILEKATDDKSDDTVLHSDNEVFNYIKEHVIDVVKLSYDSHDNIFNQQILQNIKNLKDVLTSQFEDTNLIATTIEECIVTLDESFNNEDLNKDASEEGDDELTLKEEKKENKEESETDSLLKTLNTEASKDKVLANSLVKLFNMSDEDIEKTSRDAWEEGSRYDIASYIMELNGMADVEELTDDILHAELKKLRYKKDSFSFNKDEEETSSEVESTTEENFEGDTTTEFKVNLKDSIGDDTLEDEVKSEQKEEAPEDIKTQEFDIVNYSNSTNDAKVRDNVYNEEAKHKTRHDAISVNTNSAGYNIKELNPATSTGHHRIATHEGTTNKNERMQSASINVRFKHQKFIDSGELQKVLEIYAKQGTFPRVVFTWNTGHNGKNIYPLQEVVALVQLPKEYTLPKEYHYTDGNNKIWKGVTLDGISGATFMPIGSVSIPKDNPQWETWQEIKHINQTKNDKGKWIIPKGNVYKPLKNTDGSLLVSDLEYVFSGRLVTETANVDGESKKYDRERTLVKVDEEGNYTSDVLNENELKQLTDTKEKNPFSLAVVMSNNQIVGLNGIAITDTVGLNDNFAKNGLGTHDGSIWIVVKEADGKKYLKSVHTRRFTENWLQEHPHTHYAKSIVDAIKQIKESKSKKDFNSAVFELSRYIAFRKRKYFSFNEEKNTITLITYDKYNKPSEHKTLDIANLKEEDVIKFLEDNSLRFNIKFSGITSKTGKGKAFVTENQVITSDILTTDLAMLHNVNASALISRFDKDDKGNFVSVPSQTAMWLRGGVTDEGNRFVHLESSSQGTVQYALYDKQGNPSVRITYSNGKISGVKIINGKEVSIDNKKDLYSYTILILDSVNAGWHNNRDLEIKANSGIFTNYKFGEIKSHYRTIYGYEGRIYKFSVKELNQGLDTYFYVDSENNIRYFNSPEDGKKFLSLFNTKNKYTSEHKKRFEELNKKYKGLFSRNFNVPDLYKNYVNGHYYENVGQYSGTIGNKGYGLGVSLDDIIKDEFEDKFGAFAHSPVGLIRVLKNVIDTSEEDRTDTQKTILKEICKTLGVRAENIKHNKEPKNNYLYLAEYNWEGKLDVDSLINFKNDLSKMIDTKISKIKDLSVKKALTSLLKDIENAKNKETLKQIKLKYNTILNNPTKKTYETTTTEESEQVEQPEVKQPKATTKVEETSTKQVTKNNKKKGSSRSNNDKIVKLDSILNDYDELTPTEKKSIKTAFIGAIRGMNDEAINLLYEQLNKALQNGKSSENIINDLQNNVNSEIKC